MKASIVVMLTLSALLASDVRGQSRLTVGTDPLATATPFLLVGDAPSGATQTFVAAAPWLSRISIWVAGGYMYEDEFGTYGIRTDFQLATGLAGSILFTQPIDPFHHGELDIVFSTPIRTLVGELYSFMLYPSYCETPRCGGPIGAKRGMRGLQTMLTEGDAYRPGRFFNSVAFTSTGIPYNGFGDPDKDVRFETEYSYTVAEPGPAVLVFLGLMLLLTRATYRFRQVKRLFR